MKILQTAKEGAHENYCSDLVRQLLPILLLIMLLAVFRVSTARAAGVTLLLTVLSALVVYKADIQLVLFESLKGVWSTATILYIIFPALLLYELIAASGAIDVMNDTMRQLSPHELFRILTVGWVFVGFLQGITGFGVPVAICVPMLVALGVRPTMAVIIALLGQAWGNTFGTLAVAWDVLVQISGITGTELHLTARYTALLLWILNLAAGALICWLYDRGRGLRQGAVFVLVISLIHGGGELLVAQYNASIAAFIPATVAMAAILPLSRLPMYRRAYACEGSPMMVRRTSATGAEKPRGAVWLYFAPYMVLILVTVVLLVIPSVHEALSRWSVGFAFPETRTAYGIVNAATAKYSPFHPLVDSGTVLLLTCIISYALLHGRGLLKRSQLRVMLSRTLQKTRPVAVSLILLLIISKLMSGSGQTLVLAQGITHVMGRWYALLAGVLGVIGSFVTGSNMSSNILFTDVQVNAAADLGVSSSPLLAAQTAGASAGSMISPSKIILGTTAGGVPGEEGTVLRFTLLTAAILTLVTGVICWIIL